jgi:hypothetical protein
MSDAQSACFVGSVVKIRRLKKRASLSTDTDDGMVWLSSSECVLNNCQTAFSSNPGSGKRLEIRLGEVSNLFDGQNEGQTP